MNADSPQAYTIPGVDAMPTAMATHLQPAPLLLAPVGTKAVARDCAGGRLASEAGLVLLKAPDEPVGLPRARAAVLSDPRDTRRVHFRHHDLRTQRVSQIAAGYEDANEANTLHPDPIFKVRRDRWPDTGPAVASPPTLSRFAHRVSRPALSRLARGLVDQCLAASARPPQGHRARL